MSGVLCTIDEVVLRFTDYAIPYARENYDPGVIEEQPDGTLLVTVYDVIEFKIVNLVLNEGSGDCAACPAAMALGEYVQQSGDCASGKKF